MSKNDVQVSSTWTDLSARGKGLATKTLCRILDDLQDDGKRIWYVTRAENPASIAVCEKAGFTYYGRATKRSRFGIGALGYLHVEELAKPGDTPSDGHNDSPSA